MTQRTTFTLQPSDSVRQGIPSISNDDANAAMLTSSNGSQSMWTGVRIDHKPQPGYTTESAWWAFNRLGTLTAQRWGEMRYDVNEVWDPWQEELFAEQEAFERRAKELHNKGNMEELSKTLTDYTVNWGNKVVQKAWELGDMLWTRYDEKF